MNEIGYGAKDSSDNFNIDDNGSTSMRAQFSVVPFQQYIPRIFLFDNGPVEATGLALNSFARGAVGMSTIFLGPALLLLAEEAAKANCNDGDNNDTGTECSDGGRVFGMRPTSLLTNIGIFSGLLSSLLTPLFGSIVDHTPHRKAVGQGSAIILAIVKGIEIFVNQSTWFIVSVLQVFNFVIYNAYLCSVYAYTAELSTIPNEQTGYNSRFQQIHYVAMLIFLILVMVISTILGTSDVGTARVSQTLAFVVCTAVFGMSWKWFFRPRPALREVPSGSTLFKPGSSKTSAEGGSFWEYIIQVRIPKTYLYKSTYMEQLVHPAIFLTLVMFSESATAALSTIATTYMLHVLEMGAGEIAKVFLCVFVAGIPGSTLGGRIGVALNPLRSALLCLVIFILNTTLAAMVLTGPENKNAMYVFAMVW
eukprot:CAMPEP_0172330676 /NCGR_PEP_ID=MMETSP1058-20130122/61527_1 /TAXON_ID=83371 /ORGANISM="Detonula confervacea, Strain CCMP 353" /LENGTH=420 /DNA_ID=CAMNT_0013047901 /DNA_START=135 /DNA_END=1395 /DNA_ORIENTATION=+